MRSLTIEKIGKYAMYKMLIGAGALSGALSLLAFSIAGAQQPLDRGNTPGLGWGEGGSGGGYAVPGPVAGVGLPVLIAAGGYLWLRRRTRKDK